MRKTYQALKKLSFNQKITLMLASSSVVLAFASVGISILSYRVSSDSTETRRAIATLAGLAEQSKRQADATSDQLTEMRQQTASLSSQAQAAQGQLDAAKSQTAAISDQTTAIKNSAVAAVRSADAQARAANVSERGQLPRAALESMSISGTTADLNAKEPISLKLNMMFSNTGGGQFTQKLSRLGVILSSDLPPRRPNLENLLQWGGNDFVVAPGHNLQPVNPPTIEINRTTNDELMAGKIFAFVFGTLPYQDSLGRDHTYCFAYRLRYRDGTLQDPFPAGGADYHCEQ